MTLTATGTAPSTAPYCYGLWLDGRPHFPEHGRTFERENPAVGTDEIVGRYVEAEAADVDRLVASARAAFDGGPWPRMTAVDRARVLHRASEGIRAEVELLAASMVREGGKPIAAARGEVGLLADFVEYAASAAPHLTGRVVSDVPDGLGLIVHEPVGVVAAITPYNFPLFVLGAKVPFALAAGCTVVVKPSPFTPGSAIEVARIFSEAGVPDGVFNVVSGQQPAVGARLVESRGVDHVTFTGSTAVGQTIMRSAADTLKRVTLELGGKSPNIVFADADLEAVAAQLFYSIFFNSGQVCTAGSRLLVEQRVHDELLDRITSVARTASLGDPADAQTQLGPVVSAGQAARIDEFVQQAEQDGYKPIRGAACPSDGRLRNGYFVPPTVIDGVRPTDRLAQEEVFGPVVAVMPFRDLDHAVELANSTLYGLKAAVWTRDVSTMFSALRRIRAGTVMGNTYRTPLPQARMPFGGYGTSGIGREFGIEGVLSFTETKSMHVQLTGPTAA